MFGFVCLTLDGAPFRQVTWFHNLVPHHIVSPCSLKLLFRTGELIYLGCFGCRKSLFNHRKTLCQWQCAKCPQNMYFIQNWRENIGTSMGQATSPTVPTNDVSRFVIGCLANNQSKFCFEVTWQWCFQLAVCDEEGSNQCKSSNPEQLATWRRQGGFRRWEMSKNGLK